MADGSGYTIQTGGAEGQAAEDQYKIRQATADPVCYAAGVFGGEDADPAYSNFRSAGESEAIVTGTALGEVANRVSESAGNYRKAEDAAVAGLREAAAGGTDYRPFG